MTKHATDPTTEKLHQSLLLENLKKMVDALYNRFDDDFELWELEALERGAELTGKKDIALAVHNRIEKGDYL